MTDPEKPVTRKEFVEKLVEQADEAKVEFVTLEGAPELETPEGAKAPSETTPRDEEPDLETPEKPAAKQVRRKKETSDSRKPATFAVERLTASSVATEEEVRADSSPPDEIAVLAQHIAAHPVNSHAPAWTPRTPNTTGGYS